jgi:hypothetical protein
MAKPRIERGTVIIHRDGGAVVADRRKNDNSGWWIVGGGGLDYHALDGGDWRVLDSETVQHLWAESKEESDG